MTITLTAVDLATLGLPPESPRHIGFSYLKPFALKYRVARHIGYGGLSVVEGDDRHSRARKFLSDVLDELRDDPVTAAQNHERLDHYMSRLLSGPLAALEKNLRHQAQRRGGPANFVDHDLQTLGASIKSVDCDRCAQRPEVIDGMQHPTIPVCCGSIRDKKLLAKGGECISDLDEVFDYCCRAVQEIYRGHNFRKRRRVSVQVTYRTEPHHEDKDHIGGEVSFPDADANRRAAIVTLRVPTANFNHEHYAGILYALVHELGVHAVQALYTVGKRKGFGGQCAFGEGMIDTIMCEAFAERLKSGKKVPAGLLPISQRLGQTVRKVQKDRVGGEGVISKSADDELDRRWAGVRALDNLRDTINHYDKAKWNNQVTSESWRLRLLLNLNLDLEREEDRARICWLIKTRFASPWASGGVLNPRATDFMADLNEYVRIGNVTEFLKKLPARWRESQKPLYDWDVGSKR